MDAIERAAFISVGRACGFGGLAIITFMVGLSFDPALSAQMGAVFSLGMTGVLVYRGASSPGRPYRSTETWLILTESDRPEPQLAQALIGAALREAYFWYGRCTALVTIILILAAMLLPLVAPPYH
jgi:hypothetical protein